jgi:hypothetical protein
MKTSCCALSQILVSTCLLLIPISAHCFYNPSTGRWLSRDPVAEAGFEASKTTSSIYRVPEPNDTLFVWNCPIQMIDPNGLAVTLPGFGACPLCCFTCKPAKGPPAGPTFNTITLTWQCTYTFTCKEFGFGCTGIRKGKTTTAVSVTSPLPSLPFPLPTTPPPGVTCPPTAKTFPLVGCY